jgi:glycosyltransferase involved in cell wall biosynthesis
MKIKVGFYFNAEHLSNFSIDNFTAGELGLSGTDSSFFRIVEGLAKREDIELYLFATNIQNYNRSYFNCVENIEQAINNCYSLKIDVLVFNDLKDKQKIQKAIRSASSLNITLVVWAQNPIIHLDLYTNSPIVKKIIYVERYDLCHIRHTKSFYKSTYIPNGIEKEIYYRNSNDVPNEKTLVFLGSITPTKGFHLLAKSWPTILKKVPEASLHIIGSGKLYNNHTSLGPLGLSTSEYENELIPYIGGTQAELKKNRVFCQGLSTRNDVIEILKKARVACINPNSWGSLESCSVSSLEIQLSGVPVIAGRAGGNLLTIKHRKTGILVKRPEKELAKEVIRLLDDEELNKRMRQKAPEHILEHYSLDRIILQWEAELKAIVNNQSATFHSIPKQIMSVKLYTKECIRIINLFMGTDLNYFLNKAKKRLLSSSES